MNNRILYMKLNRHVQSNENEVFLKDVGKFVCQDPHILAKTKVLKLYTFQKEEQKRQVFSVLKIIELIQNQIPEIESIENIGETEIVVEQVKLPQNKVWKILKITLVSCVCFFGTMFTIMAFHNDIGVHDMFSTLYQTVIGNSGDGYTVLEFFYSLGLALGIIVFFNHIGPRRITKDPTPVEVEMRLYENDVTTTLIETADREGNSIDVS